MEARAGAKLGALPPLRAALQYLREHNPLVAETLTCYEREFHCQIDTDLFPSDAGIGGMAVLPHSDAIGANDTNDDRGGASSSGGGQNFARAVHAGDNNPTFGRKHAGRRA
mgnify:CR=1 FL=1